MLCVINTCRVCGATPAVICSNDGDECMQDGAFTTYESIDLEKDSKPLGPQTRLSNRNYVRHLYLNCSNSVRHIVNVYSSYWGLRQTYCTSTAVGSDGVHLTLERGNGALDRVGRVL